MKLLGMLREMSAQAATIDAPTGGPQELSMQLEELRVENAVLRKQKEELWTAVNQMSPKLEELRTKNIALGVQVAKLSDQNEKMFKTCGLLANKIVALQLLCDERRVQRNRHMSAEKQYMDRCAAQETQIADLSTTVSTQMAKIAELSRPQSFRFYA